MFNRLLILAATFCSSLTISAATLTLDNESGERMSFQVLQGAWNARFPTFPFNLDSGQKISSPISKPTVCNDPSFYLTITAGIVATDPNISFIESQQPGVFFGIDYYCFNKKTVMPKLDIHWLLNHYLNFREYTDLQGNTTLVFYKCTDVRCTK